MYLQRWYGWCHMKLLPSRRKFCVHQTKPCTCHFMQSHIRKVHACLAVTCHLHSWQNDRDDGFESLKERQEKFLLQGRFSVLTLISVSVPPPCYHSSTTVVTRGWNGYRNKSQHRKSTLEKKILLPLLQGFEPATFQS